MDDGLKKEHEERRAEISGQLPVIVKLFSGGGGEKKEEEAKKDRNNARVRERRLTVLLRVFRKSGSLVGSDDARVTWSLEVIRKGKGERVQPPLGWEGE